MLACAVGKCLLPRSATSPIKTLKTDLIEMTGVQCVGSWQVALLCAERLQLRDSRGKGKLELHMSGGAWPVQWGLSGSEVLAGPHPEFFGSDPGINHKSLVGAG